MPEQSLDRATLAITDLATSVRTLTHEVERDEALRSRKVRAIEKVLYLLAPGVILLILLAVTNFVLLNRVQSAAEDAKSTNELVVSCLRPETPCGTANRESMEAVLDQIRQTQFVIAVCQRQNPITTDPEAKAVTACVQSYYPNFALPPRVKK